MFGRSKPVVFDRYGSRRSRWRLPPWLVLLLVGVIVGAAGVVLVQERYLPPRLSPEASATLRTSFEKAESERVRLQAELGDTARRLAAALAEKKRLADDLGTTRQTAERLRGDVASLGELLPADPRGGVVQVRAARFTANGGKLVYDVVLSRDRGSSKPLTGVMQFVLAGSGERGAPANVKLQPVAIAVGSFETVRGDLPLPQGFDPRQATINVLDRVDGKLLGMRVMHVK